MRNHSNVRCVKWLLFTFSQWDDTKRPTKSLPRPKSVQFAPSHLSEETIWHDTYEHTRIHVPMRARCARRPSNSTPNWVTIWLVMSRGRCSIVWCARRDCDRGMAGTCTWRLIRMAGMVDANRKWGSWRRSRFSNWNSMSGVWEFQKTKCSK